MSERRNKNDNEGEQFSFRGFPAVMIVKGENYSLMHGYRNIEQLHAIVDSELKKEE